jgi:hypothetical protein
VGSRCLLRWLPAALAATGCRPLQPARRAGSPRLLLLLLLLLLLQIAASEASEGEVQRSQEAQQQRAVLEAAAGTGAQALPQSLLSELASLGLKGKELPGGGGGLGSSSRSLGGPGSGAAAAGAVGGKQGQQQRPLIQELGAEPAGLIKAVHGGGAGSVDDAGPGSRGPGGSGAAAVPCSYSISDVVAGGRACIRVAVELPGLRSAAGVEVEVEGQCLLLGWAAGEERLALPEAVDSEGVVARFDRRRQQLTVTLPRA